MTNPVIAEEDYQSWYQVEVIVYANNRPLPTTEIWPLEPLSYPPNFVSISSDDEADYIYSLQQLEALKAYNQIAPATDAGGSGIGSDTQDFIFKSRSRNRPIPITTEPGLATVEGDSSGTQDLDGLPAATEPSIDLDALFEHQKPIAYAALDRNSRTLNALARSVNRSSLYRLLLHKAWLQPIESGSEAMPVLLQAGEHYDDLYELDGTITISRSRYLHVATDLWFTEFTPRNQSTNQNLLQALSSEDTKAYPAVRDWETKRGNYLPVYSHRMNQSRRMRSSTLHYIDHPNFGMLVKIDRFEWQAEPGAD